MQGEIDEKAAHQRLIRNSIDVFITIGLIALVAWYALRLIAPFVSILIWAVILAVALHPVYVWLRGKLGGRGSIAAGVLAVLGLVLLIGPTIIVVDSIVESTGRMASRLHGESFEIPAPDPAVREWPLIGTTVYHFWEEAHLNLAATAAHFAPHLRDLATTLLTGAAGLVGGVIQYALSIVFAAVFLSYSAPLGRMSERVAARVTQERGKKFIDMVTATIRNVSRGVIGVAIIQGGLASIGLIAVGLPFAGFLAGLAVVAAIVQVPMLVILPAIIYVWTAEPSLTAALFTAYMIPVMLIDNVLKPILMARGLTTPMVVILIGVICGTLSAGLVGLFIGPVVLAAFYEMIWVWVSSIDPAKPDPATSPSGPEAT